MLVRSRQVQGWGLQPAADARLTASVWEEQLDRRGVDHRLYNKLVDMAVDYRTAQIGRGQQPTPLTVELMLACFEHYKQRTYEEYKQLKVVLDAVKGTQEMVANGFKSKELGLVDLLSVTDIPDHVELDFDDLVGKVIDRLQVKYDGFLQEKYLHGQE